MPAASRLNALASVKNRLHDVRADETQREEAEDDARDPGQDLQDGLDRCSRTRRLAYSDR